MVVNGKNSGYPWQAKMGTLMGTTMVFLLSLLSRKQRRYEVSIEISTEGLESWVRVPVLVLPSRLRLPPRNLVFSTLGLTRLCLPEWLGSLRSFAIAFNDADPDDDQTPQDLEEFCDSLAPTARWSKNLAPSVVGRSTNLPCQAILVA